MRSSRSRRRLYARATPALLLALACSPAGPTDHVWLEADSPATRGSLLEEAISIETSEGQLVAILEKECPLPCSETVTFGNAEAGQGEILVYVYRGNASTTDAAVSLGTIEIAGLPAANADGVEVQVTFRADQSGVSLSVEGGADGGTTLRRVDD